MKFKECFFSSECQHLVGQVLVSIVNNPHSDEGFILTFQDGSVLDIGYSGDEGWNKISVREEEKR